jgi:N-acetylglucosaminyldiphosphoundecaprenol N-acetyl-beta-D-mannosaminyltransferase
VHTGDVLGFSICTGALESDVEAAFSYLARRDRCRVVACANPHSLIEARSDPCFARALREADLLIPDGAGILLAGRALGTAFAERVAGTEFFRGFSDRAAAAGGVSYFFLGSTDDVLERIRQRLAAEYPAIGFAGKLSPPFKDRFDDADNAHMVDAINAARPDVLWVGMTAPKQELWLAENRSRIRVPLAGAIGAVFDFYAGTKARAPAWVCDMGLEWLPRLVREPRRLWRRNFVSTPRFVGAVLAQSFFRRWRA